MTTLHFQIITLRLKSLVRPALLVAAIFAVLSIPLRAQDGFISEVLTDRIHQGDGVIDILKDVSGEDLASYFDETDGKLVLAVDLNEAAAPPESGDSVGVAIRQAQLSISTTDGDFTFSDFFTDTTAMLRDDGASTAQEFYTLFGRAGSSSITGVSISTVEDVLWLDNIAFTGDITSASLAVELVEVPGQNGTKEEKFFDFTAGKEEFGIVNAADAVPIDEEQLGVAGAPASVSFTSGATAPMSEVLAPPGAPLPPLVACLGLAVIYFFRTRFQPGK